MHTHDVNDGGNAPILAPRFEVLPFDHIERQAEQLHEAVRLTVTLSPKHGVDKSLDVGVKLRSIGHAVTIHIAARTIASSTHLDAVLGRAAAAGIDDLFVVGGDAREPLGPYSAAADLIELMATHPQRPARIGIAGYPEGHPLIPASELEHALQRKAPLADYIVTQLCFDASKFNRWLIDLPGRGIALPVYAGAPGLVDRRKLMEIAARIGVGPSLRYLKKQRGVLALFRGSATDRFHNQAAHQAIAGFHYFTFNELIGTWRLHRELERRLAA